MAYLPAFHLPGVRHVTVQCSRHQGWAAARLRGRDVSRIWEGLGSSQAERNVSRIWEKGWAAARLRGT